MKSWQSKVWISHLNWSVSWSTPLYKRSGRNISALVHMNGPQSGKAIAMVSSPKQSPSALRQSPLTYPRLRPLGSTRGVREGGIYPQALEKGLFSERALMLASFQGVCPCRVAVKTEKLCAVRSHPLRSVELQPCWMKAPGPYQPGTVVGTLAKPSPRRSYLFVPGSLVRNGAR